jgi:fructose-1-phosphate kinase PfkB-like protein
MSLDAIGLVKSTASITPHIVADTSDLILTKLVKSKKLWLIKPNFHEFCYLIDKKIPNTPKSIFTNAQNLLKYCPNFLITRGSKGAVFINKDFQIIQDLPKTQLAQSTVGCGDYALAGFLAGLFKGKKPLECLDLAIKTGVKRAHSQT